MMSNTCPGLQFSCGGRGSSSGHRAVNGRSAISAFILTVNPTDDTVLDVPLVREAQVLLRSHVAEHGRAGPAEEGLAHRRHEPGESLPDRRGPPALGVHACGGGAPHRWLRASASSRSARLRCAGLAPRAGCEVDRSAAGRPVAGPAAGGCRAGRCPRGCPAACSDHGRG